MRRKSKPLDFRVKPELGTGVEHGVGDQLRGDEASILSDGVELPLHNRLIDEVARDGHERWVALQFDTSFKHFGRPPGNQSGRITPA